ncbi:MAG: enolase C-terminal domain-like protein [Verrucomicrobiales bacterium]
MKTDIAIHRYTLTARAALNARHRSSGVNGLLLRAEGGYACFQPWESLGDEPIARHLEKFQQGNLTPLLANALAAAAVDGQARREGRSLFDGLVIPESHATLTEVVTPESAANWRDRGFTTLKVKLGPDWRERLPDIHAAAEACPDLVWRFDFNESISADDFFQWAKALGSQVKRQTDVVEDPCPFSPCDWGDLEEATGLRLAVDRRVDAPGAEGFVLVCKPARDDAERMLELARRDGRKLIVTSNMDHPLGVAWAAYWAARFSAEGCLRGPAGLATTLLFEPDAFAERLAPVGCRLTVPAGTGLGFDELLSGLVFVPASPLQPS